MQLQNQKLLINLAGGKAPCDESKIHEKESFCLTLLFFWGEEARKQVHFRDY